MKTSVIILLLLIGIIVIMMSACAPGGGDFPTEHPAGFFFGIWHGWIAPISLIISFFNPVIRIYEVNNTGFLYDLGFYIAIISGFGGVSMSRKKLKSNRKS